MNIHEYQGKGILRDYGIKTPKGVLITDRNDPKLDELKMPTGIAVVKSQIQSGARGKAGGIKLGNTLDEIKTYVDELLGKTLVTEQTGPEGRVVKSVLIEEGFEIKQEYYVAFTLDRKISKVVLIASKEGGMNIEDNQDKIMRVAIDPLVGIRDYQCREVGFQLGIEKPLMNEFQNILKNLYDIYMEKDCSLVEINPLVLTGDERLLALDCKMNFDSNALFKHKDIMDMRDLDEEDPKELEASKFDLSYISLDGNIGCMVNGAGLAMATMDIINYYGGEAANFLDVGGSATEDKVKEAFKIILQDTKVEGIFVNIFGGIMKCDIIANGIVNALRDIDVKLPIVVRLEGTNSDLGKKILKDSKLNIESADSIDQGAH